MKKITVLIFIGVLLVALGGVGYYVKNLKDKKVNKVEIKKDSSKKNSLYDWVLAKASFRCEAEVEGAKTTLVYKDGKIKVTGQNTFIRDRLARANILNDGEWVYIWSNESKQGIKYSIEKLEKIMKENQGYSDENKKVNEANREISKEYSVEELLKAWENLKEHCRIGGVDNSEFTPPSDVEFIDMSSILENTMEVNSRIQELFEKYNKDGAINEGDMEKLKEEIEGLQDLYNNNMMQ